MGLTNTARSFTGMITSRLFVQIVNVLTIPVILRYFDPDDYGKVSLFSTLIGAMAVFLNFTESAKSRFGREEYDKERSFNKTFWGTLFIKLPLTITFCILALVYKQQLLQYLGLEKDIMLLIYILFLMSLFGGNTEFLVAQEKYKLISYFGISSVIIRLATIVLLLLNWVGPTVFFMVLMYILTVFMKDMLVLFSSYKLMGKPKIDFKWTYTMFVFSIPFLFHFLGEKTVEYIDTVVIRKYQSFTELGYYSVSYKFYMFALVPLEIVRIMVKPRMISLYINKNMVAIRWFYHDIVKQINFLFIQLFSLVIVCLPMLILLIGKKYSASLPPLAVLLTSMCWMPLMYMSAPMFHASKKVYPHIIANIIAAVANLVFDLILIPKIGIMGGAVSTSISVLLAMLFHIYYLNRFFKINLYSSILYCFPILLMSISFIYLPGFFYILVIYLIVTIFSWVIAIKSGMFSTEALDFFNKLGISPMALKFFNPFYKNFLIKRK